MYPIHYSADVPLEGRSRASVFFRYFLAIPGFIALFFFGIGAYIATIIAWFSIVLTGSYPDGLYSFNERVVRLNGRLGGYLNLLNDDFPPLGGEADDSYPIQITFSPKPAEFSRVKTFFRLIYGIPVFIIGYVQSLIAGVLAFLAWFAILFTGKMPAGFVTPLRNASAYSVRSTAFMMLMTDDYPPFSLEDQAPRGSITESDVSSGDILTSEQKEAR